MSIQKSNEKVVQKTKNTDSSSLEEIAFGIPILVIDDSYEAIKKNYSELLDEDFDFDSQNVHFFCYEYSGSNEMISGDITDFIDEANLLDEAILIADFSMPENQEYCRDGIHLLNYIVENNIHREFHCFVYTGESLSEDSMRDRNASFNGKIFRKEEFSFVLQYIHDEIQKYKGITGVNQEATEDLIISKSRWGKIKHMINEDLLSASLAFDENEEGTFLFNGMELTYSEWLEEVKNNTQIGVDFAMGYITGIMKHRHVFKKTTEND